MEQLEGLVRRLCFDFVDLAGVYIHGLDYHRLRADTVKRRFVANFGVSPRHCAFVWIYCRDKAYSYDNGVTKLHLLWTLNLLKSDATEHALNGRWRVDEKTIRKWTKLFLHVLSDLQVIDWSFRKDQARTRCNIFITVDGTDFRIKEPSPFSPSWYSHKFKGPGVRYEIGVCIATGWIIWVNGPYRCGTFSDETIARLGLHHILEEGERYIADGGYKSSNAIAPFEAITYDETHYMRICRSRHETINRYFKAFASIANIFKRHYSKHALFAHSVINIVQIGIMHGEKNPFQVDQYAEEPLTWPENLEDIP